MTHRRIALVVVVAFGLLALWFSPNIAGYVAFRSHCKTEGGAVVREQLRRGVGWKFPRGDDQLAYRLRHNVAYVELPSSSGQLERLRYRGGLFWERASYDVLPVRDGSEKPFYTVSVHSANLAGELRLSRTTYEVREFESNRLVIQWNSFGYSHFNQDATLLAAPSGESCPQDSIYEMLEDSASYSDPVEPPTKSK